MPLAFAKFWPEEVARAGLQRFAVLHHRLDAVRALGAGEAFAGRLLALDDGHGHPALGEVGIDVEHAHRLFDGFLARRVRRVAFLPEELGGAQEQPRAHLPAHDVGPLIDQAAAGRGSSAPSARTRRR